MAGDNTADVCRTPDNRAATLPTYARLPINRCNLPAVILGSLTFQNHPTALALDGVAELHRELFTLLDGIDNVAERARLFRDYVAAHFCLDHLEEAGLDQHSARRAKANWLRVLRGWSFDADGREGAVLKGWVESRFGLLPRFHGEPLRDFSGLAWHRYQEMRAAGISGTNALEAQLDLLYAFCQYEFDRLGVPSRLTLYRGINRLGEHEVLAADGRRQVVLFNNLTSFTASRERAGEFGDYILEAEVPTAKVFFHCRLLPDALKGEDEHLVIGGAYEVTLNTL
ncbi:MAG TPA: NAD(+)--dinitrogen-reductase ADP-D-ribosyltransferase [Rhodocyclaceae bacterium]|nr:NAD(+)--dinitrogen-reductase ADP-D-ribosyltransferase [Rhodocyclaceae bacterium]